MDHVSHVITARELLDDVEHFDEGARTHNPRTQSDKIKIGPEMLLSWSSQLDAAVPALSDGDALQEIASDMFAISRKDKGRTLARVKRADVAVWVRVVTRAKRDAGSRQAQSVLATVASSLQSVLAAGTTLRGRGFAVDKGRIKPSNVPVKMHPSVKPAPRHQINFYPGDKHGKVRSFRP